MEKLIFRLFLIQFLRENYSSFFEKFKILTTPKVSKNKHNRYGTKKDKNSNREISPSSLNCGEKKIKKTANFNRLPAINKNPN